MWATRIASRSMPRMSRVSPSRLQLAACSSSAKTFQHQKELPQLPVPDLNESLDLYLRTVRPLVESPEQFEQTVAKVEKFRTNDGPVLQERLVEHAKKMGAKGESWLETFWLDNAYLAFRAPLPTNSNYYLLFDPLHSDGPIRPNPLDYATQVIQNTVHFKRILENEQLPPEYLRKTNPQCMDQYKKIFGVSRIAEPQIDRLGVVPSDSKHIVVIRDEQLYVVQVIDESGELYNPHGIRKQLEKIVDDAAATRRQSTPQDILPVGAITAIDRDKSANLRGRLATHNAEALRLIDEALFAITLDQDQPRTVDQAGEWINGGRDSTAGNRWFEKTVNYVVFENGYAGLSGEHSPLDAPMVGSLANFVLHGMRRGAKDTSGSLQIPSFQKLEWQVDESLARDLHQAKQEGWDVLENCELNYVTYQEYGADWVKKVAQASPDAFMQMSIQLAYYYTHQQSSATYETGTARAFYHGRTDTVRTLSEESKAWTESMVNDTLSTEERCSRLRKALESHSNYMKRAVDGKVIDRHLLGLRLMKREGEQTAAMFDDYLWKQSTRFRISTSNMSSPYFKAGFGPTEADGYGICYDSRPESLRYSITSFRSCKETSTESFAQNLIKALDDMRSVFHQGSNL